MKAYMAIRAVMEALRKMKSEESRRKLVAVILAFFFIAYICLAILVYLITTPMSILISILGLGNGSIIRELKRNPAVIRYSAAENYDAIRYIEDTIMQGGKEITYYNQLDMPWNDMLYGFATSIGHSGCGPTSMAIVLSTLMGYDITPAQMADWSYNKGYLVQYYDMEGLHASTSHSFIPAAAAAYDLICTGISKGADTRNLITTALAEGKYVVAIMGPGHFTEGGHFIVLSGVTEGGKIQVADCASRSRTGQTWELDIIIEEARTDADAGGPFWVISVPPPPVEEEVEEEKDEIKEEEPDEKTSEKNKSKKGKVKESNEKEDNKKQTNQKVRGGT
jgi:hypothetical protein